MLIGFHGKYRSGKDQSFQFLQEAYGARREAFADRLKLSAARSLGYKEGGIDEAVAFCNMLKQKGIYIEILDDGGLGERAVHSLTGREYLQYYGTEAHREVFAPDFWVSAALADYNPAELLVVTDVRFSNEAEAIQSLGGWVVHIVRPETDGSGDAHASEQVLPPELIDYTIVNDGTLEDLRDKVLGVPLMMMEPSLVPNA